MTWVKRLAKRLFFKEVMLTSMDDLIHHALQGSATAVEITPMHKNRGLVGLAGISMGALSSLLKDDVMMEEYYLRYVAIFPKGNTMAYEGKCVEQYASLDDASRDHEREALRVFLDAEAAARTLRAKFSTIRVEVVFETGVPVSMATRRKLYARAGEYGLRS